MAFNLMAFAGGAADGLSQRLDDEERKYEKLQDEARTRAERQRLERKASRERDKKIAEESINSLVFMGYSPEQAQDIATKGKMAVSESVRYASIARDRGQDISTFYSVAGTPEEVGSTLGVSAVADIGTGTPPVSGAGAVSQTTSALGGGIAPKPRGFDNDRLSSLLKPELDNKVQSSLDAAYAVAVQNELNAKTPDAKAGYAAKAADILGRMKALEDEEDTGRMFSEGTVTAMVGLARKSAHDSVGFSTGKEGEIIGGITGRVAEYNTAELMAAKSLYETNMRPGTNEQADMMMAQTVQGMVRTGTSRIKQYGRRIANGNFEPLEHRKLIGAKVAQVTDAQGASTYQIDSYAPISQPDAMSNASQGQYKVGDVVIVQEQNTDGSMGMRIKVYTGLENYSAQHNMFIDGGALAISQ